MYFEVLDNKIECYGFYYDGQIHNQLPEDYRYTWSYSPHLADKQIDFASLYVGGKDINQVCPAHLKPSWDIASAKLKAFLRSFLISKVNLDHNCFFDLVPERFLYEYYELKSKITQHVFQNYKKPENYDYLLSLAQFVDEIRTQKLNIDSSSLKSILPREKAFKAKLNEYGPYVRYNMFGTITGRLSTMPNSFPILSMDKGFRSVLKPNNNWFIELDFNGAELRTFLALAGKEQPDFDIHDWNVQNVFNNELDRDKAKEEIFSWLYGGDKTYDAASTIYDREATRNKYWDGHFVSTPYGRKIESDKHHAMSYLIQSTFADIVLRQVIKVHKYLQDKKSKIAFCVHDNIIIDLAQEERWILNDVVNMFSSTDYGKFMVNIKAGNNYGDMKSILKN
jgi:hypothetical protein